MKGRRHTETSKRLMSESQKLVDRKGQKNPFYGKDQSGPNNPRYGKKASAETREKMSKARKGVPKHPGFGAKIGAANKMRVYTQEMRQRLSDAAKKWHQTESGKKNAAASSKRLKSQLQDPEFLRKRNLGLAIRPNKPELVVQKILDEIYPNEYTYTGDGSVLVGRLMPDFTNVNGKRKIIEVFGEAFHNPAVAVHPVVEHRTEDGRKKALREHGYETLIIWVEELNNPNDPDLSNVREMIKNFHES